MKQYSMMTIIEKILFFTCLVLLFSCEDQMIITNDQIISINCTDCTEEDSPTTIIDIDLDASQVQGGTLINVYEGNLGDSILYNSFNTTGSRTTVTVRVNKKYTITATYQIQDKVYIAVDSATPRVLYDKNHCEKPCYFVYDKSVDLRLKYMK